MSSRRLRGLAPEIDPKTRRRPRAARVAQKDVPDDPEKIQVVYCTVSLDLTPADTNTSTSLDFGAQSESASARVFDFWRFRFTRVPGTEGAGVMVVSRELMSAHELPSREGSLPGTYLGTRVSFFHLTPIKLE
jgi:hypothetical protein